VREHLAMLYRLILTALVARVVVVSSKSASLPICHHSYMSWLLNICRIKGDVSFSGTGLRYMFRLCVIVAISCLTTGKPEGKWPRL
jgi:hypothetical protein